MKLKQEGLGFAITRAIRGESRTAAASQGRSGAGGGGGMTALLWRRGAGGSLSPDTVRPQTRSFLTQSFLTQPFLTA